MAKAIAAKFASVCNACGQSYPAGTPLTFKKGFGWAHHPECPPKPPVESKPEEAEAIANVFTLKTPSAAEQAVEDIKADENYWTPLPETLEDTADAVDLLMQIEEEVSEPPVDFDGEELTQEAIDLMHVTKEDFEEEVASSPEGFDLSEVTSGATINTQLATLKEQMRVIQKDIANEKSLVQPVKDEIAALNESEKVLYEAYVKESKRIRTEREAKEKELQSADENISKLNQRLKDLEKDMADAMSALSAQAELDKIKQELEEYFSKTVWGQKAYDFQIEDIIYAVQRYEAGEHALVNCNKMGAGKMMEAQATTQILKDKFREEYDREPRILWVTAKSIRWETHKQWKQWVEDERAVILTPNNREERNMMIDVAVAGNFPLIVNYDALSARAGTPESHLLDFDWDIVILDEASAIKNGENTARFLNLRKLVLKDNWQYEENPHRIRFLYSMTGTIVENAASDVWPHLHLANPKRFPNVNRFISEFSYRKWDEEQKKYVDVFDIERILKAMIGKCIRQDPKRIDAGRPDKVVFPEFVERTPAQDEFYQKIKEGILAMLDKESEKGANFSISAIIAQLNYLRQANVFPGGMKVTLDDGSVYTSSCNESGKIDRAMEMIQELNGEKENVVVWATFKAPLWEIERRCKELGISVAVISGETRDSERDAIKQLFDDGEIRVLCTVLAASGGEVKGANFNKSAEKKGGASKAIFLDLWWNPAINEQAEDRIWRQNNIEPATIYQMMIDSSVDLFIVEILQRKENLIAGLSNREELRPAAEWLAMLKDML